MIGFLGGSFDPVHYGHLKTASSLKVELNLSALFLLPCAKPVQKSQLNFSDKERLDMLKIACQEFPDLAIDTREIDKSGTNYTIDTLQNIKSQYPDETVLFIIGADNYLTINTWQRYLEFSNFVHLVVLPRQNCPQLKSEIGFKQGNIAKLSTQQKGILYFAKTSKFDISAREINQKITKKQDLSSLLPNNIINYIKDL